MNNGSHRLARFAAVLASLLAALPVLAASAASSAAPAAEQSKFTRGLLWKVEREGTTPSHVFGTIHSDDPRVTAIPRDVTKTLSGAKSFTMEVDFQAGDLTQLAAAMLFSDERTLKSVVGDELYAKTLAAYAARGLPTDGIEKQKPWSIVMALSMPIPTTGAFLDLLLQQRAKASGKPIFALETVAEQLSVFDSLTLAQQTELLRDTLAQAGEIENQLERLIRAYLARDLARLMALAKDSEASESATFATVMRRLFSDRNHRMTQRMQARLAEGGAFIAVGAGHLGGPDGILALLEQRGYRLTPVY